MATSTFQHSIAAAGRPGNNEVSFRNPQLDGLRGIAVLSVMMVHFWQYGMGGTQDVWNRAYSLVASAGWVGVDLFFVLSGFLITGILYDSRSHPAYYQVFYARRTIRIFPLYYTSLVGLLFGLPLLTRLLHQHWPSVDQLKLGSHWEAWLYLFNWPIAFRGFEAVPVLMRHFWSLAVEEQFYLGWPAVVRNLPRRRLMTACSAMAVFAVCLRVVCQSLGYANAAYVATLCRMDSLAAGAAIAVAIRDANDWAVFRRHAGWLLPVSAIALAALIGWQSPASGTFWMNTAGIALLAAFFGSLLVKTLSAGPETRLARLTGSRVLRFFGTYSYALYVFHLPLMIVLERLGLRVDRLAAILHSQLAAIVSMNAVALLAVTLAALSSWHLLEKRCLSLKSKPFFRYDRAPAGNLTLPLPARLCLWLRCPPVV